MSVAQCPQATITVEINTDQWGDETSWEIYDQVAFTLIASGGGANYAGNSSYTHNVCVDSTRCYLFVIYDAFNDGMCCTYGQGSYTVRYNGVVAGTGGVFATSESVFNIGNCSGSGGDPLETDNTTYTPPQLVTDVLLGSCVSAFNIQYTGESQAVGYFSNGAGIGMEEGILLTSGSTAVAEGPNTLSDATVDWALPGDADLNAAAGLLGSLDAAALEFDFVSFNDTVTFNYIFASEEYPEYVCSQFNDAFAFLVSGTGYAPNTNIALIPGTSIAVAINSINNGSSGSPLYPPSNCTSLTNTAYYVNNSFGSVTEYDAYTVPLTATMVVVPCDTYHIKLVVADVGDGLYDSGVFLQAQSFSGGQSVNIRATDNSGSKNTLESCSDGRFTFSREDTADVADPIVVYYTVSGTALEGTDYTFIPDSIVIPANQVSASLYIYPVQDGISEGGESIILTYSDACACNSFKRDTIFIFDNAPITVSISGPTGVCNGQSAMLTATAQGSLSVPYSYVWSTAESTASIQVSPLAQTTYTVTATDRCGGQTATASHTVNVASASASFTVASPQCFSQNDFDFTNTGSYSGAATFTWSLGDGATRATEDVLNYAYAASGDYTVRLIVSDFGCADTFTQTVSLRDSFVTNVNAFICPDSAVFAGGAWQNTNGAYFDFLTAANGCDSTIVTVVSILQYQSQSRSVTMCAGDSFFAGGAFQTTAGAYLDTLPSNSSCDTILTTNLTVENYVAASASVFICPDDSVFIGGDYQNTAGVYVDTIPALVGCDTIRTTTLSVNSNIFLTQNITICAGDSFFTGNAYQTTSGVYLDTIQGTVGCDTILTTNLTALNPVSDFVTVTICAGDSVQAGGAYQTLPGIYADTFIAANGCDSVLFTTVEVRDTFLVMRSVFLCPGDSLYAEGAWQTAPGVYTDHFLSAQGCDSVVATTLSINTLIQVQVDVPLCEGDSFFAGGAWQTTAGNYVDSFSAAGGCDSIVTTVLAVYDTFLVTIAARLCEGDSLFVGGAWQTQAGQYVDSLQTSTGCDSTIVTILAVDTNIAATAAAVICAGESYFAGGALQTASGIYTDTFTAITGCDSIVTTTLTVLDTFLQTLPVYICAGDSFWAGGAWQTQNGTYIDSLNTVAGCDSVIITQLFIETVIEVFPNITLCAGDSIFAGGAWQTQAGIFIDSFIAAGGCDSVVTTTVVLADTFYSSATFTLCAGDSFFAAGAWQTTAGLYIEHAQSATGCDSTIAYILAFDTLPRGSSSATICSGDSLFLGNEWQTIAGIYNDTLLSSTGCDSIHTTALTVNHISASGYDEVVCEDETATLTVAGSYFSYTWSPGGETNAAITTGAGDYILTVGDTAGCTDTAMFRVREQMISIIATPADTTVIRGESVPVIITANQPQLSYNWQPATALNCADCSTVIATPDDDVFYLVTAVDSNGCSATTTVQILVDTIPVPRIYIPNAFTPNGDGVNDDFFVYVRNESSFHLLIFDRWGEKLFETYNPLEGWNGTYRGKECNPGVYVYYVDAQFAGNSKPADYDKYLKGSLTLIR